jgi:type I restriction enzyme S subunit
MTEGNGEVKALPKGWIQLKLENVAEWGSGGTPSRKNPDYFKGNIPWIKTGELKGKYIRSAEERITKEAINESSAKIFPKGSVAIAMYGATIGKTSIIDIDASTNQACAVAKPLKEILFNEFLYYYLSSQTRKFVELGKGGAQPNISQTLLKSHPILLPPINEQERIVEKIEELFSDVDQGVESLKTAKKQLKVYRQAVLKWAFEGKLTEAWRKPHQATLKTGEALLAEIKAERENRYQQQLAEWETAVKEWEAIGKMGKKPNKPQTLQEPSPLRTTELAVLPELPFNWCYVRAEAISDFITKGTTPSKENLFSGFGDVPFIKVYNLTDNGLLDFTANPTFVSTETHNGFLGRSKVLPNDVLMNIVGPPLGKVSLVPKTFGKWNINQAVVRYRTTDMLMSKYLMYYLLSQVTIDRMSKRAKATAGQFNLTLEICRDTEIPICSPKEQEQIVQEIESRLSICDQLEATIIENLQKAEALRQSILKQAFEGKLVPQDPNDEPAEKLLERIQAERLVNGNTGKKSKPSHQQLTLQEL